MSRSPITRREVLVLLGAAVTAAALVAGTLWLVGSAEDASETPVAAAARSRSLTAEATAGSGSAPTADGAAPSSAADASAEFGTVTIEGEPVPILASCRSLADPSSGRSSSDVHTIWWGRNHHVLEVVADTGRASFVDREDGLFYDGVLEPTLGGRAGVVWAGVVWAGTESLALDVAAGTRSADLPACTAAQLHADGDVVEVPVLFACTAWEQDGTRQHRIHLGGGLVLDLTFGPGERPDPTPDTTDGADIGGEHLDAVLYEPTTGEVGTMLDTGGWRSRSEMDRHVNEHVVTIDRPGRNPMTVSLEIAYREGGIDGAVAGLVPFAAACWE